MRLLLAIRLVLSLPIVLSLAVCRPVGAQTYVVKELGSLGGSASAAYGVNTSGQVVGWAGTGGDSAFHAFLHNGKAIKDLGTLGGNHSWANGINAVGKVVGWAETTAGPARAFLYSGGLMIDLGTLGGEYSEAYAINSSGQVVGWAETVGGATHAFLYSNGSMTDLGTLGGAYSEAYAINASGQVVGASSTAEGRQRAFLWQNGSMMDLGTLPDGATGSATALNDAGQVVGAASTGDEIHAFLYSDGSMADLGTLGGANSAAHGINNRGQIVGAAENATGTTRAFVWDGDHGMRDLNRLIPVDSGWELHEARAINDAGQIAGVGNYRGNPRAFLLTPIRPLKLTLSPALVPGCKNVTGTVTLNVPAPTGGVVITLTCTNPAAAVPAGVTVPKGKTSATFPITTQPVIATKTGRVTAAYNNVSQSATLKVRPIGVQSLGLSPNPVVGGNEVVGTVTLECPAAPGDIVVALTSTNRAVAEPTAASLTIPAGSRTGTFTIRTTAGVSGAATLRATANNIARSKKLIVAP